MRRRSLHQLRSRLLSHKIRIVKSQDWQVPGSCQVAGQPCMIRSRSTTSAIEVARCWASLHERLEMKAKNALKALMALAL